VQIVLHPRSGDRDADAIQIGDDRQECQHAENSVSLLHVGLLLIAEFEDAVSAVARSEQPLQLHPCHR
jgi:hypothetical protein